MVKIYSYDTYFDSVKKFLEWIKKNMLTFDEGYWGIYERIRIDKNIRTNWVRPDCNAEVARTMMLYEMLTGDKTYSKIYTNIKNWLLRVQDNDPLSAWYGTFPFYLVDGYLLPEYTYGSMGAHSLFQNDNGKLLIYLIELYRYSRDNEFLKAACKLADYWISIQRDDGNFMRKDGRTVNFKGPAFILWLYIGLIMCYRETGNAKYKNSADKSYSYICKELLLESGRLKTSFEISKTESWRPMISETVIGLYAFSKAYEELKEPIYLQLIDKIGKFILLFQHENGGILNCHDELCASSISLQNNPKLCDFVYVQGFALLALITAWKVTSDKVYKESSERLSDFLVNTQCKNESPLWDGAWRGSFNVETQKWDGRANQNNLEDEGGMYSVYTGWSGANIAYGLLLFGDLAKKLL